MYIVITIEKKFRKTKRFTYIQQAFVYWCCHGRINRFIGIIEKEIVKKQERKKKKIHVT